MSPSYPSAIEVFDLAENEDLSPLETDPEKLAHKYKEVMHRASIGSLLARVHACLKRRSSCVVQLQIKHAVTQAEIQQLKRKVKQSG